MTALRISCLCIALAVAGSASAANPQRINLSARLVDGGKAVDGSVSITINLFRTASGGTSLWSEAHTVTAADGLVAVELGGQTPLDDTVLSGALFIELTVGSTVLAPRLTVDSVPFALRSDRSDRLGDLKPGDVQHALTSSCSPGSSIRSIDPATGNVACETDDDTVFSFGTGLVTSGTSVAIDPAVVQRRVSGTCLPGSSIRTIDSAGNVTCQPDTNTTYAKSCGVGQYIIAMAPDGTATCSTLAGTTIFQAGATGHANQQTIDMGTHAFCALLAVQTIGGGGPVPNTCAVIETSTSTWALRAISGGPSVACSARCLL